MQVTFKNNGMIEEAGIEMNGLSVIADENDTGKSTTIAGGNCSKMVEQP